MSLLIMQILYILFFYIIYFDIDIELSITKFLFSSLPKRSKLSAKLHIINELTLLMAVIVLLVANRNTLWPDTLSIIYTLGITLSYVFQCLLIAIELAKHIMNRAYIQVTYRGREESKRQPITLSELVRGL